MELYRNYMGFLHRPRGDLPRNAQHRQLGRMHEGGVHPWHGARQCDITLLIELE